MFRFVIRAVIDDMAESTQGLRDQDTGKRVQEVQADILKLLTDLYDSFKLRLKQGKGGGGGGGGGKPPLVPDIVQVHLMKKMQEQILRKTQSYKARQSKDGEDLTEAEKQILRRLSDEQGELGRIMGKFIEKFDQAKQDQEKEKERQE